MWDRNKRNLGIILVILVFLLIINLIFLYLMAKSESSKTIKSDENNVILFKSSNEIIKQYAVYAFIIFCIITFVFELRKAIK
jgi:preprotein translocase subunit SecG